MYMNKHTLVYHMLILLMKFRNWWTLRFTNACKSTKTKFSCQYKNRPLLYFSFHAFPIHFQYTTSPWSFFVLLLFFHFLVLYSLQLSPLIFSPITTS